MIRYSLMKMRIRKIYALLLTAVLTAGSAMAQVRVNGSVFGGGNMADVKINTTVNIQTGKVLGSVYGGGNVGSVGTFTYADATYHTSHPSVPVGKPYECTAETGLSTVVIEGDAEIGPDNMQMYHEGVAASSDAPDDKGHVFGAGKGELASPDVKPDVEFIAYVNNTEVTVSGTAFIKGSVYGGSENGHVLTNTYVKIQGGQIGCGKKTTLRHPNEVWADNYTGSSDLECASWEYKSPYAPYDPFANASGNLGQYSNGESTEGGRKIASDGHTFYGNVFGGGSGSIPYFDETEGVSKYLSTAGIVEGDTRVEISGGHILTNVYGGCESTDVLGKTTIKMTDGTIGVPRPDADIKAHPVTGYLFGAGKGDQRIFFNKETNVKDTEISVEGGRIYGSVYGGGEDGHVFRNVTLTVKGTARIGTSGNSYYDGNVFGGGRGFGGEALTAGNVGGAIDVNIEDGTILGSVYGGGRLASVGYGLYLSTGDEAANYGKMREDNEYDGSYPNPSTESAGDFFTKGRGKITVNIKGGTIGNDVTDAVYGGNVFGGSMGRLTKLDGSAFDAADHWSLLATAKKTTVNVTGGTIKRSVYGGGEMGTVTTDAIVTVSGGIIGTTGKGGAEFGNVYGGGKGYVDPLGIDYVSAGIVKGNTEVTIENGTSGSTPTVPSIYHNVYGGGAYGSVGTYTYYGETEDYLTEYNKYKADGTAPDEIKLAALSLRKNEISGHSSGGTASVTIKGGIIGTNGNENGMVFGSSRGDVGAPGSIHDRLAWVYNTEVTIGTSGSGTVLTTPLVKGSVYGSGENGHTYQNADVQIHSGTIGIKEGEAIGSLSGFNYPYRGNVYGGGCGTDKYDSDGDDEKDAYNALAGIVRGNVTLTIDGGQVVHNVYGAGAMGSVGVSGDETSGKTTVTISGGRIGVDSESEGHGHVFGAARGELNIGEDYARVRETEVNIQYTATPTADNEGQTTQLIVGSVFGGGEAGNVLEDVNVYIKGGMVCRDVYGGGAKSSSNTANRNGTSWTDTEKKSALHKTTVSLTGGRIDEAYGGGLGEGNPAYVYGDVTVELNKEVDDPNGCIVRQIFGCNNIAGSPKGHTRVHVFKTVGHEKPTDGEYQDIAKRTTYDVEAVYGGGNKADFRPIETTEFAEVIIEGCEKTSIENVYGGGNAAATPANKVQIAGCYIIDNVFGGGNGTVTAANVGYNEPADGDVPAYETLGTAITNLAGGRVHHVYGGSNSQGNILHGATITNDPSTGDCCSELLVQQVYGGGKNAIMEGGAEIVLGCMPNSWIEEIYAGSENADVGNDVSLTLTSGKFGRVFGGNKSGGKLDGSITVNIEENPGCDTPIIIGELYGGGNLAPYSIYGYNDDGTAKTTPVEGKTPHNSPRVNVYSFTSIGNIYGGGLGARAVMVGSPTININEVSVTFDDLTTAAAKARDYAGEQKTLPMETGSIEVTLYPHVKNQMGVIGNVFGGGNAANVNGNTNVNIGTESTVKFESQTDNNIEGDDKRVSKTAVGADIRGNVYGGGNQAEVTGDTNVTIGKKM